ncbi:hypothetical protein [Micromonospora sp. HUAS LYJ1]|uniref:hypothetical protein n=1 Tax=Micromonospora sp. HUAS LYJ1 TaxID=3061626 RepID=UPI002671A7F0|nr:hypothetical protein [Micromonospora sp. HUAS LYJ1]WKU03843.1 hypothetical protein Q2K16_23835 [Micromonospora sp. HUAS LYJ1]
MTGPILVPNLAVLREEFNARWPRRDKRSDGWIGDQAHATRPSGHNPDESGKPERTDADKVDEVRAIDLDADVDPAPADELFAELDRIRRTPALRKRLIYIIYRRKIASASNGWEWKPYSGDSPHTEHGHLSGHPDYDNDRTPWGVATKGDVMDTKQEAKLDKALDKLDKLEKVTWATTNRAAGLLSGATTVTYRVPGENSDRTEPNKVAAQLAALADRPAVEIDYDRLADAIVRRVLAGEAPS